ncbi:MAG: tRNA uridine(34) 5-carboxymethylaminomethyl modification radical SAM/GNAT enzyme Elp3, partial [Candidatus Kerfeldbacteria bacterium CG15_BIG_FIL_POST_REV_8_21_14_020_45_12]
MQEAIQQIIRRAIDRSVTDDKGLKRVKAEVAKEFGIEVLPNSSILSEYQQMIKDGQLERNQAIWDLFSKRRVRNLSGVAVITVLTKPYFCPGRCVYCPTEARMPKSYLANEPGAARAVRHQFDPFDQVQSRLKSL